MGFTQGLRPVCMCLTAQPGTKSPATIPDKSILLERTPEAKLPINIVAALAVSI